jgi:hypothetical protein
MSITITKRPFEKVFSGNPVHYELYSELAAGDATVSFEVKVRFKKIGAGEVYGDVVSLPYAPKDGFATVDLKEILDSVLQFDLPQFDVDETKVWKSSNQTGKFYLQFREITTVNPDPSWDDTELDYERFVIKGGLNDFKYQGNNFWLNYYDINLPFLTWQYKGRLAAADERMYLAWLCNTDRAGISIVVKIYYTDETVGTKTVGISGVTTSTIGNIFYLPAGCNQLGLNDVTPTKTIYYWTLQAVDVNDNSEWSELFKYELDNRNDYIGITLNYRNSLGGLDSARVRGSVEKKLGYTFSELEKTIQPDYFDGHYFSPQKIISGNVEQIVYSGNFGLMKKEEQDRLRDAQMIRETWTEKNKKWIPLNITTKDFSLVKNDDQRWSMPIEFTLGYGGSEYYTPDNVDLGTGVFTNNVCMAFLSPLQVIKDSVDHWSIIAGENDPQNASEQFRYRVIRLSDNAVFIDWTPTSYMLSPQIVIPDDTGLYKIEVQAICTNNVYGKKTSLEIDTTVGGTGGGGGGGTVGGGNNSIINNLTGFGGTFSVNVNDVEIVPASSIGAFNTFVFDVADDADATVDLFINFSPAFVRLISNGGLEITLQ